MLAGLITLGTVGLAACLGGDGDDAADPYDCPPTDAEGAAALLQDAIDSIDPETVEGPEAADVAFAAYDGPGAPGATATVATGNGSVYYLGVYIWPDQNTATSMADEHPNMLVEHREQSVTLSGYHLGRVERATFVVMGEGDRLERMFQAMPCVEDATASQPD